MIKENLLLLFGGESTEHEVSEMSASNVIEAVNREKYNLITVGITKEGKWYLYQGGTEKIKDGTWEQSDTLKEAFLSPSKSQSGLVVLTGTVMRQYISTNASQFCTEKTARMAPCRDF